VAFRATVKGLSLHRWPVVLVWRLLVRVARLNFLERLAAAHHSPPMVVSQLILVPEFIKPGMVARELPTPLQWALQRLAAAVAVPHSQEPGKVRAVPVVVEPVRLTAQTVQTGPLTPAVVAARVDLKLVPLLQALVVPAS
jgi:hypothetical protein